jgi:hypothetical protein
VNDSNEKAAKALNNLGRLLFKNMGGHQPGSRNIEGLGPELSKVVRDEYAKAVRSGRLIPKTLKPESNVIPNLKKSAKAKEKH